VSPGKIIKQDRTSFRHSTGFFGCAMPATCARRASLRLRMTPFFFDAIALALALNDLEIGSLSV
jgi:hypothetical protein